MALKRRQHRNRRPKRNLKGRRRGRGKLPSVSTARSLVIRPNRIHRQLMPKSMYIHLLPLEVSYTCPIGVPATGVGYFDVNLNSINPPPFSTTASITAAQYGATITTGVVAYTSLLPYEFTRFIGNADTGLYKAYCVHASKITLVGRMNSIGDQMLCAVAPINRSLAYVPTTYQEIANRPYCRETVFSEYGNGMAGKGIRANSVTNYVRMRDILGMSKMQYNVLTKILDAGAGQEAIGTYAGTANNAPNVDYNWRFCFQTQDNAVTQQASSFQVFVEYWVEFFHSTEAGPLS